MAASALRRDASGAVNAIPLARIDARSGRTNQLADRWPLFAVRASSMRFPSILVVLPSRTRATHKQRGDSERDAAKGRWRGESPSIWVSEDPFPPTALSPSSRSAFDVGSGGARLRLPDRTEPTFGDRLLPNVLASMRPAPFDTGGGTSPIASIGDASRKTSPPLVSSGKARRGRKANTPFSSPCFSSSLGGSCAFPRIT